MCPLSTVHYGTTNYLAIRSRNSLRLINRRCEWILMPFLPAQNRNRIAEITGVSGLQRKTLLRL